LGIIEDVFGFITSGSIGGLSPLILMIIPLVIGVVVGFLLHKFLKFAIIAAAIAIIVAYLGFYTLNLGSMSDLAVQYGPIAVQFGTILFGMLPLGIGFIVGFVIGFLVSK
jgi:uncharacterized membrane protein (Fun14 family)